MWHRSETETVDGKPAPDTFVWQADERTGSLAEKRVMIMADPATGTTHLTLITSRHAPETFTIMLPPAVATVIGTALIESAMLSRIVRQPVTSDER